MVMGEKEAEAISLVPAVDKAFKILEMLKGEGSEHTIVEIARELGLNKSTVHKLLVTLCHHGVVQRDEQSKRYRLGIALVEFGNVALNNIDIRRAAKPFLRELVEFSGETACLAGLQGTKVVIIDKKEPPSQIRVSPVLGWRFPATMSAMGKALLAWLTEAKADEIMRREGLPARTPRSIIDPLAYKAEMAATRRRGYAIEIEEFHEGVRGVAAPVFDARGKVIASLAVGGPAFRMSDEKLAECGVKCIELAREISRNS